LVPKEIRMKRIGILAGMAMAGLFASLVTTSEARGQAAAPAEAPKMDMTPVANPVSTVLKGQVTRFGKNMTAAAEAMIRTGKTSWWRR
jgi:hypothetical protein